MTDWLFYATYLVSLSGQLWLALISLNIKANRWAKWGGVAFFGIGALSSLAFARQILTEESITVALRSGSLVWLSLPRTAALAAMCFGWWQLRFKH